MWFARRQGGALALPEPGDLPGRSLRVAVVLGIVVFNLAVALMAGFSLKSHRAAAYERVDASIQNLAELVERDVSSTLDRAGIAMGFVANHLEQEIADKGIDRSGLWQLIDQAVELVPGTSRIGVFDEAGRQVCGTRAGRCLGFDIADRDYFSRLKSNPRTGFLLSGPFRTRTENEWALFLSTALKRSDGAFAGVVVAVVPLQGIKSLFGGVQLGQHGAINLRTEELVQVVRHPGPIRSDDDAVNRKVSSTLGKAILATPAGGFYEAPTALDGIERRNAYRKFARYPLYILVGLAPDDFLDAWRGDLAASIASCVLFLIVTVSLAGLLLGALRRRESGALTVQSLLAERDAMLNSEAIAAVRVKNRHIVWASDSFARMFGYRPDELVGMPSRAFHTDDDSYRVFGERVAESARKGEVYRTELDQVCRDGSRLRIDVSVAALDAASGEMLGTFVDITEQRGVQAALEDSERRFRLASEAGRIGFWSLNVRTGKAWRSPRHAEIFGHEPEDQDWSAERLLSLVAPADRERIDKALAEASLSGKIEWTARIFRADGAIRWVSVRGESVRDGEGRPSRLMGSIVDNTEQVATEQALRLSERRFRIASTAGQIGVVEVGLDSGRSWRSESHARIFGDDPGEANWSLASFISRVVPEDRPTVLAGIEQARQSGIYDFECRITRRDGAVRWIGARGELVAKVGDGEATLVGTVEDVTDRRLREDQLRLQGEVLLNMQEGVALMRVGSGEIVYANPKFESLFGYGEGELIGMNASALNAPTEEDPAATAYRISVDLAKHNAWQGDVHNMRKDGTTFWTHASVSRLQHLEFGDVWVSVQGDIDARKHLEMNLHEANALLERLAVRDPLTGLFNRRYLDETVARELQGARRDGHPVAFMLIDIDHFKRINDTFGHRAGDEVLRSLGSLLTDSTRGSDVACRYGGEEFLVVMPGAGTEKALVRAGELRRRAESLVVVFAGRPMSFTISIGIASFPDEGADGPAVTERADRAMYAAKRAGRNCVRSSAPATDESRPVP